MGRFPLSVKHGDGRVGAGMDNERLKRERGKGKGRDVDYLFN